MLPAYQGAFSAKILSVDLVSNALNFDGVDDRVISSNDVKFKINLGTIEGWIKTSNAGSSYCGAFGKTFAYFLYLYNNELIVYDWGGGGNRSTGIYLNDNTWHHIAMSFNSGVSNGTLIYIDGVLKLTTTMTVLNQDQAFTIGSVVDGYGQFYTGNIDDVRVWNVIRTQVQIQDNMNSELVGNETGLVAYYTFNQGVAGGNNTSITTVANKSANALNGTLSNLTKNGATSNFVIGKVKPLPIEDGLILSLDANNANSYSGAGSSWNDISGNNYNCALSGGVTFTTTSGISFFNFSSGFGSITLPKTTSMTYSIWAKSSVACTSPYMVLFSTGSGTVGPQLYFRACANSWNTGNGGANAFANGNYSAHGTNWHNYTVVNDGVASTTKLYYDGVFIGSAINYQYSAANVLTIGGTSANPWFGGIGNVKASNKALTDAEILNSYISTKGIFGY